MFFCPEPSALAWTLVPPSRCGPQSQVCQFCPRFEASRNPSSRCNTPSGSLFALVTRRSRAFSSPVSCRSSCLRCFFLPFRALCWSRSPEAGCSLLGGFGFPGSSARRLFNSASSPSSNFSSLDFLPLAATGFPAPPRTSCIALRMSASRPDRGEMDPLDPGHAHAHRGDFFCLAG